MDTQSRLIPTCVIGAVLVAGCSGTDDPVATSEASGDAGANEAATDSLDELFQDGSPEDIAAELEAMVEGGDEEGGPVPLYKGVTV